MNIFVLDRDPKLAAQYHCDKHVIKMITETCQLLSTAVHLGIDIDESGRGVEFRAFYPDLWYKKTHENHPCAKWVRASKVNFTWTVDLLGFLIKEYDYRFGKLGKFEKARIIEHKLTIVTSRLWKINKYPCEFALVMPSQYIVESNEIGSYRKYYTEHKRKTMKMMFYTKRERPIWLD